MNCYKEAKSSFKVDNFFLPTLNFTDEERNSSMLERERSFEPLCNSPDKSEDMFSNRPIRNFTLFEAFDPDNINKETVNIPKCAHFAFENQELREKLNRVPQKKFNPKAYDTSKATISNESICKDLSFIDILIEM